MDNLVLTTVAMALDRGLVGCSLEDVRQESVDFYRLRWAGLERSRSIAISMHPEVPWIARPAGRARAGGTRPGRFALRFKQAFRGARLESVVKPSSDRRIELRFADARKLVVELAVHGANLVLVDAAGIVFESLRQPRSARRRVTAGQPYAAPGKPAGLVDPWECAPELLDGHLERLAAAGEPAFESIRRHLFGVGSAAARLVCDESAASRRSHGEVLARRLADLLAGGLDPVIELPREDAAVPPRVEPESARLWPWAPDRGPLPGLAWSEGADAAETAGWWYGALEERRLRRTRLRGLRSIVLLETRRNRHAARKCEADLRRFEDPGRHRVQAEALLAGLALAERIGDGVRVPDPNNPSGPDLIIPAQPRVPLPEVADRLFVKHRRALRGLERTRIRLDELLARGRALEGLRQRFDADVRDEGECLAEMRRLGLPVALEPDTRSGREAAARGIPRLEGVRVYHASSGEMILAGKGARENHRLTFKLAAPHDFWFHALGATGAHVVLRNDARAKRPGAALFEAAAVAAFHSEASSQPAVDVQWTLRKNVRKPRGAKPGTVVVKRFETVRVRPKLP